MFRASRRDKLVKSAQRSNPQRACGILINGTDVILTETIRISRIVNEARKFFLLGIKTIESAPARSNPKGRGPAGRRRSFIDRPHRIMAQALRIIGVVDETDKFLLPAIELVQAIGRSDPKPVRLIFINGIHRVVAEAVRIVGVIDIANKFGFVGSWAFQDKLIEAAAPGSNPERTRMIFADRINRIMAEALGVVGVMKVVNKTLTIAIKAVQPAAIRSDPERTVKCVAGFIDGQDRIFR
ncbi:MAG: hypothetical protein ALAOOOJD_00512 [bacterium]|nr:hypothetical protein [bacterium]